MESSQQSYRKLFKATSIFGGVQLYNIVIGIIKSKVVAILIGPAGMGIMGLLQSAIAMIESITNLGLEISAVRSVSEAYVAEDNRELSSINTVLRRWVWITGLMGLLFTIVFSKSISELTFGNSDYQLSFVFLSLILLFQALNSGNIAILQGTRKIKFLAKASIVGYTLGFLVSVPLLFVFEVSGIVPVLILTSFCSFLTSSFFSKKINVTKTAITIRETFIRGRHMIILGIMLSLSSLTMLGVAYIIRIYLQRKAGIAEVGLFTAGFAIVNTYVGMVFTAISKDYYPQLAAISGDREKSIELIERQGIITILVLAPIIAAFLTYIPIIVNILLSKEFVDVIPYMHWAILGILVKGFSWPLGYVILARGDSRVLFMKELIINLFFLGSSIFLYNRMGIEGLGVSFLLMYILNIAIVISITRIRYSISYTRKYLVIFLQLSICCFLSFIFAKYCRISINYFLGTVILLLTVSLSIIQMNNVMDVKHIIKGIEQKLKNNSRI